jgi:hypothetical protein
MKRINPLVLNAILLMLSVGNFFRIDGSENTRPIHFFSIFAIGMLTALLIKNIVSKFKQ